MLKKESIEALETRLGLESGSLVNAIGSEDETDFTVPDGKFFTNDGLNTFKENVIKENQADYESAKKVGVEMAVKEIKREKGWEFEGKDLNALLGYYGKQIEKETGKEPTQKLKELKSELETLQNNWKTEKQTWESEKNTYQSELSNIKTNSKLMQYFDELPKGITKQDAVSIFRNYHDIKTEDDVTVFYKNGKKLTDQLMNPLSEQEVVKQFIAERGWVATPGRGKFTSGGSSDFKTMNEVMKYLDTNKIDPNSDEGMNLIKEYKAGQS